MFCFSRIVIVGLHRRRFINVGCFDFLAIGFTSHARTDAQVVTRNRKSDVLA